MILSLTQQIKLKLTRRMMRLSKHNNFENVHIKCNDRHHFCLYYIITRITFAITIELQQLLYLTRTCRPTSHRTLINQKKKKVKQLTIVRNGYKNGTFSESQNRDVSLPSPT